jgi:hypothetical protein
MIFLNIAYDETKGILAQMLVGAEREDQNVEAEEALLALIGAQAIILTQGMPSKVVQGAEIGMEPAIADAFEVAAENARKGLTLLRDPPTGG